MTGDIKISAHNPRRGTVFILSSSSGTGKTTLASKIIKQVPGIRLSVSVTTRKQLRGEQHGREYFFVTPEAFEEIAASGQLLEQAEILGNKYGTLTCEVENILNSGGDILFVLDSQGAKSIKEKMPGDVVGIFILPPSRAAVEQRLRVRQRETEAERKERVKRYTDDIRYWKHYDYVVVNEVLEECLAQISEIIRAERLRCHRQTVIAKHIANEVKKYERETSDK